MDISTTTWRAYADYADGRTHSVVGNVQVLEEVWSPQLDNQREVLVYLPPSYAKGERCYPVLYMHDGQNLFDDATSYVGEWQVDETMEALSAPNDGAVECVEAIVVGIPNMREQRIHEYSPFNDARTGVGRGDQYLTWIVETVKPLIDGQFRTLPDRQHTGIMGSSLGGLISLYAFFHFGHVFGLAGVMSPSLWLAGGAIFEDVEKARFVEGKIYMDIGTLEGHGRMLSDAKRMHNLLVRKGYKPGRDLCYVEDKGGMHNEAAWSRRLPDALRSLLQ